MWKYVSRRIRDTFERSANHFDKRSTTNVVNSPVPEEKNCKNKRSGPPCQWFMSRKCWKSFHGENDTNRKRWNFEHLNRSWIGAITWSSALVLGWYTSQIIHLKLKHSGKGVKNFNNIICTLKPYVGVVNKGATCNNIEKLERILKQFTPTVHLISNEHGGGNSAQATGSVSSTSADSSENDLGEVLNSIENKLGLAAIENGQHQVGINLLRSAANRHHAPALYNLGLCYENGLGVTVNEKMVLSYVFQKTHFNVPSVSKANKLNEAMEFYRSAASMEHPGALYNLGIYYGQGRGGLQRDLDTATRLLRLAAVQGQQDAIDALKSLEMDIEPPHIEIDSWPRHHPYLHNENLIPTQSSLFVENVNFQLPHMPEATIY